MKPIGRYRAMPSWRAGERKLQRSLLCCLLPALLSFGTFWAGSAFALAPQGAAAGQLPAAQLALPSAQPVLTRGRGPRGTQPGTSAAALPWALVGCAALTCAYAARAPSRSASRGAGRSATRHYVVACKAAGEPCAAPPRSWRGHAASGHVAPATAALAAAAPEGAVGAPVQPQPLQPLAASPAPAAQAAAAAVPLAVPEVAPSGAGEAAPDASPTRPRPALLAGGTRHARRRRSSSGAAARAPGASERTARRSVGARLTAAPECPAVLPASYDPSRLRTRIQSGLQSMKRLRTEQAREFQTPSASLGPMGKSHVLRAAYMRMDCGQEDQ